MECIEHPDTYFTGCISCQEAMSEEIDILKHKIEEIENLIVRYGQIDGGHHKAWCIDQVMKIIKGKDYEKFIWEYENLDDEGNEMIDNQYLWDAGIAP